MPYSWHVTSCWGMQTYGENLDWLEAANDREYASLRKYNWKLGITALPSMLPMLQRVTNNIHIPNQYQMFPPQNGEDMPSDLSEEEIWADKSVCGIWK